MNQTQHQVDSRHLLEQMLLIRAYEEAIVAGSTAGKVPGTCTSVGQEAAAVGVVNALVDTLGFLFKFAFVPVDASLAQKDWNLYRFFAGRGSGLVQVGTR